MHTHNSSKSDYYQATITSKYQNQKFLEKYYVVAYILAANKEIPEKQSNIR